ncbi:MAG: GWxTD domain-containing protein [Bacteroidota bacterium]
MKSPGLGFAAAAGLLLLAGCGGPPTLDLGQPGKSLTYIPGTPSFDFEAIPDDANGSVQVSLSLPSSSLTFLKSPNGFAAHLEIDVRAFATRVDTLIRDYSWPDTIAVRTFGETTREDAWVLSRSFKFVPGDVRVVVEVLDDATGRREIRSERLRIPSPNELHPFIGRIILQARGEGGWATIVPLHIPSSLPDLRASARIFGMQKGEEGNARFSLLQFKVADVVAQPPYFFSDFLPTPGEAKQVWFDRPDTVRSERIAVAIHRSENPALLYPLDGLQPGLYELSLSVTLPSRLEGPDSILEANRVFSIKSPTFPKPSTLKELTDAMTYLLNPREKRLFEAVRSQRELRDVFDSLWLSFRPTKEEASALLKRYYTRVEEANRLYTDFKEGWKTDRGMLYIIFGPPQYIMNSLDRQIWTYDLPGTSQEVQFIFRRVIIGGGEISMRTFVLYRDTSYEWAWDQMVSRWRYGGSGW